jgi:hypothetical protein
MPNKQLSSISVISIYICILLILSTNFGAHSGWYQYPFFILIIIFSLPSIIRIKYLKRIYQQKNLVDFIPLFFLFVWNYGLLIGFVYQWPIKHIISNFAGMTIYSVYYALKLNPDVCKNKILKILLIAVVLNTTIIVIISTPKSIHHWSAILLHSYRIFYSVGTLLIFLPAALSIYGLLHLNDPLDTTNQFLQKIKIPLIILVYIFSTYILVYNTNSKGFLLGWLALVAIISGLKLIKIITGKNSFSVSDSIGWLFVVTSAIFISISPGPAEEIAVNNIFSPVEKSNSIRMEQMEWMIEDSTFWGRGLGASIEGYQRNSIKTYGFEVVYLNVVHKFGIFSGFVFLGYLLTLLLIIKNLWLNQNTLNTIIALGCMTYLFPSVGNPLIFHPIAVILHVMALYLLHPWSNHG